MSCRRPTQSHTLPIAFAGDGISIGHRRITLSTCGVVPLIPNVGSELGVLLAVSLHAANDDLRNEVRLLGLLPASANSASELFQLVPINKQYPLSALMEACRLYPSIKHNRTLTFECVVPDAACPLSSPHTRQVCYAG